MTERIEHVTVSVTIDTGDDDVTSDPYRAVADLLLDAAYAIKDTRTSGVLLDANGNRAGDWEMTLTLVLDDDEWAPYCKACGESLDTPEGTPCEWCGEPDPRDAEGVITMTDDHVHEWGPVERSHFAGTLHRKCLSCTFISLDLDDEDEDEDEDDTALAPYPAGTVVRSTTYYEDGHEETITRTIDSEDES